MIVGEVVSGQQQGWRLLKKLGEGDAGEVYLVESLLERKVAILKRPHRSSFTSDMIRQSSQIETEGKILRALNGLHLVGRTWAVDVPSFIDVSKSGNEFSERFFIIIGRAPGLDLSLMSRAIRQTIIQEEDIPPELTPGERAFLDRLARQGEMPTLLLLRALHSQLELLEKIHSTAVSVSGSEAAGVLWNDVKPEHLFWDPANRRFTVIDWGNGRFLESDGATRDRRNSRGDDYAQFLGEMGRFLTDFAPHLQARLDWPEVVVPGMATATARTLKEKIISALVEEAEALRLVRQREADLLITSAPDLNTLTAIDDLHDALVRFGELPDYSGAERICSELASCLAAAGDIAGFRQVCAEVRRLPVLSPQHWHVLDAIAKVYESTSNRPQAERPHRMFIQSLTAGLRGDWTSALWELMPLSLGEPEPAWWSEISQEIRVLALNLNKASLSPYTTLSRLSYTLQDTSQRLTAAAARAPQYAENGVSQASLSLQRHAFEKAGRSLKEDVLRRWKQLEPDPPDNGLEYREIDRLIPDLITLLPETEGMLTNVFEQPKAQVRLVLDAWGRREFEQARKNLRSLLLWDPDRRRVLLADRSLQIASTWLERVENGPENDEPLIEFLTHVELDGRELRARTGPARWLDALLDAFSQLRKGASPVDLLLERPELISDIPWLSRYEAPRPAILSDRPVELERAPANETPAGMLHGLRDGLLGQDGELLLAEPLDTWAPEARGSSARVFLGYLRGPIGMTSAAVKLMRPDRSDYALPLFKEEIQILTIMRDVPGVARMLECGLVRLENGGELPPDDRPLTGHELKGEVQRFGADQALSFLSEVDRRLSGGWIPYITIEKMVKEDSLALKCDAGFTRGHFLPIAESLRLAMQILDVIQIAHNRNIVYRDHKILHYYWLEAQNGVMVIDWNVARRHPEGLSRAEKEFDLVQFAARALHHIITGRTAPGALPLGPTRPEEIDAASHQYRVQWTYDDQRLPTRLKELLESALTGSYSEAKAMRDDLLAVFRQLTEGN